MHQVLLEESVIGWKEYEMEVMRDVDDNVVIICSIENFDPMGVHTGDSITVAPAQTLTDKEYQRMRDASIAVIREIGVETGGSNIQFAIDPEQRADGGDRDEPAREPLQRAGLEGHRFPHRQDRRQAGRRLPAARAAQRHHPRDDGLLRADDRLRGGQDPAVRLREVPRGRLRADHADEERGRDDGHRADVQGVVSEGAARAGGGQFRLRLRRQGPLGHARAALAWRKSAPSWPRPTTQRGLVSPLRVQVRHVGGRNLRADGHRPLVPGEPARDRRHGGAAARGGRLAAADAALLREAKQAASPTGNWRRICGTTEMDVRAERKRRGVDGHVQIGRHLRRRVRGLHALLLFDLRGRGRNARRRRPGSGG